MKETLGPQRRMEDIFFDCVFILHLNLPSLTESKINIYLSKQVNSALLSVQTAYKESFFFAFTGG